MHGITAEPVEGYLYSLLPPRDEVLVEIENAAAQRDIPIVGPAVARILRQLALITGAKNIFEMGSAIGYSTIWWARAVGDGGRVIYTDGDRKHAINRFPSRRIRYFPIRRKQVRAANQARGNRPEQTKVQDEHNRSGNRGRPQPPWRLL